VKVDGSSIAYANKLLERGIVVTPGIGFGSCGEGYIRFALTRDEATLRKVIEQLGKMKP
jgi:aspartate/methionine/tyrosine aminotransferase